MSTKSADADNDAIANDLALFTVTKTTVVGKLRRVPSLDTVVVATTPRSALATCIGTASMLASETPVDFETPENSECDEFSTERALRDATVTTRYKQRSLHQSLKSVRSLREQKETQSLDESPSSRRSMQRPLQSIAEEDDETGTRSLGDLDSDNSADAISEEHWSVAPDDIALHVFGGSRLALIDNKDSTPVLIIRESTLGDTDDTTTAVDAAAASAVDKFTKIIFNPDPQGRAKWQIFVVPNGEISERMLFSLITAQLSDELDPLRMCNCKANAKKTCMSHPPPDMAEKIVACYTLDAGLVGIRQTDLKRLIAQHKQAGAITEPGLWRRYRCKRVVDTQKPISRTFKFKMFYV